MQFWDTYAHNPSQVEANDLRKKPITVVADDDVIRETLIRDDKSPPILKLIFSL